VRQLIKRILREETRKDLSPLIKELLNTSIGPKYKRIICTFDAIPPWKTVTNSEDYQIMVSVIGGPGSKRWPNTQDKVRERDAIVNDVWHTLYNFIGLSTDVFLRNVKSCDEVMSEGLRDTSKIKDGNKRVVFDMQDLLDRGIIFITQGHNLTTGKMTPPEKDPKTGEMYYDSTNLITLWNITKPEKGTQDGIPEAMKHPRPDMIDFWQDNQSWLLDDEKYKQILRSIELNDKDMNDEELTEYSRTLKNARQQGVGLRFPKSAIKSNPSRFRPYNR
jgi:hypothetical protein